MTGGLRTRWHTWGGILLTVLVCAVIDGLALAGWIRPPVALLGLSAVVVLLLVREYQATARARHFLGQVAHEVGNPAAVIQHTLEQWRDTGRSTPAQAAAAMDATRRLVQAARQVQGVLRLPVMPDPSASPAAAAEGGSPMRLLIIDDEDDLRTVLQESTVAHGFQTSVASTVDEALSLLADGLEIDVVVCDLMMPDGGAETWLRRSGELYPQLAARTIVITGGATSSAALALTDATPDRLLYKPFAMSDLRAMAHRLAQS